jgi:hypothetical protein
MSLTTERIAGRGCSLTVGSALSNWTRYTLEIIMEDTEARAASAGVQQRVELYREASMTVEGYRGVDESFTDLADVGDVVTSISGTDLPADLVATYGPWKIARKSMEQGEDPGTYSLELRSGFLDVVASGT